MRRPSLAPSTLCAAGAAAVVSLLVTRLNLLFTLVGWALPAGAAVAGRRAPAAAVVVVVLLVAAVVPAQVALWRPVRPGQVDTRATAAVLGARERPGDAIVVRRTAAGACGWRCGRTPRPGHATSWRCAVPRPRARSTPASAGPRRASGLRCGCGWRAWERAGRRWRACARRRRRRSGRGLGRVPGVAGDRRGAGAVRAARGRLLSRCPWPSQPFGGSDPA